MLIRQPPIAWLQFVPVYRCMRIAPIACGSNSHVSLTQIVSSGQRKLYQDGMSAKRAGRLSIAFAHVLDEVLKNAKKSAKEIAEHGEHITEKVRNKGVVLPDYLMKLLQSMKSAADKS